NLDLLLGPEGGLFEADLHVVEQVVAAPPLGASAPGSAPEDIAEDVAEDVAEGGTGPESAKSAPAETGPRDAGMAELVVLGAFLGIGKHFVGLGHLLELVFGGLVVRVL